MFAAGLRYGAAVRSRPTLSPRAARRVGEPYARILTADKLLEHNTPQAPTAVTPRPFADVTVTGRGLSLTLPPHSFVTVQAPVALAD